MKRNIYAHEIKLEKLTIRNKPRDEFRQLLENVKYLGYKVENISDGRKIVITKPSGKFVYGSVKREDFMVWVYNTSAATLWLISHKDIYNDLELKGNQDASSTIKIIDALEAVCNGVEPDNVLKKVRLKNPIGEIPEVLLKVYKWIWGQEDCNYPNGEGREMSMKEIRKLRETLRSKRG